MAAGKVEFELSLDDRKALEAIRRQMDKQNDLQRKYNDNKKSGQESFDGVASSIGKVAGALGLAGGAGAAFQAVLQQIQEQAAAINREAQKSLEVGRQTSASFGSFVSNNPGISQEELQEYRGGLTNALQAFPQQGEGAEAMGIAALEQTISAGTELSPEQRVAAVREALQVRSVNPNANLAGTAGGIAALMQNFGFDENQASNFIIGTQQQSRVANFEGVAKGLARISPAVATSGVSPLEAAGLFSYGTTTLQDDTGDQTATNVSNMLTRLTTREQKIEEKAGISLEGNALEMLGQIVEARRSGAIGDSTFSEVLPMIAEGQGQNLIMSMVADGGAGLRRSIGAIGANDIMGGDALAGQQAVLGGDASFRISGAMREVETLANQVRGRDVEGQESAVVRSAMMESLNLKEFGEGAINNAGQVFDAMISEGLSPAVAAQSAMTISGRVNRNPLARLGSMIPGAEALQAINTRQELESGGSDLVQDSGMTSEEFLRMISSELREAVHSGMSGAIRDNAQRQPMTDGDL